MVYFSVTLKCMQLNEHTYMYELVLRCICSVAGSEEPAENKQAKWSFFSLFYLIVSALWPTRTTLIMSMTTDTK